MISDEQIQTFEQEGAVTIDSPLSEQQLTEVTRLMDRLLPLGPPRPGEKHPRYRVGENNLLQAPFVSIVAHPFFEQVMKRLLHGLQKLLKGAKTSKQRIQKKLLNVSVFMQVIDKFFVKQSEKSSNRCNVATKTKRRFFS